MEAMEPQRLRDMIAEAKAGDAAAYEQLLRAYGRRLYGYFLRAAGSHHDAEDLLGELMLRLVRTLKNYDERGRFEPWLFRVAANLVRDRIRRSSTRPAALSLAAEDESGQALADRLQADPAPVDADLVTREQSARLMTAMERLDDTTRHMILLRHFGEMSFRELAGLFGCPVGTALAKVHRGLQTLRKWMGESHEA